MILIILTLIVAVISAFIVGHESNPFGFLSAIGRFFVICIIGIAIWLLGVGIHFVSDGEYTHYEYSDIEIVSLNTRGDFEIDGHFILGTGSINGGVNDYYITYINTPNGLLRKKLDSYNVYIKETDNEKPKIKNYYVNRIQDEWKSKWFGHFSKRESGWYENTNTKRTIIVPVNTLYKEFYIK